MNKKEIITLKGIEDAQNNLFGIVRETPLERNYRLSKKYKADIYLKREDLQIVRSYKLRGAYNYISSLDHKNIKGIVCASAGNHAQGVALCCNLIKLKGYIYMPSNTPKQKIQRVKDFGGEWTEVRLVGDTFDEAMEESKKFCKNEKLIFIHPFDEPKVIEGQATVCLEILKELPDPDIIIGPIGGGGLMSGISYYIKNKHPKIKVWGVEPEGAASMLAAFKNDGPVALPKIDTFVDGVAVKLAGKNTYNICSELLDDILLVSEGKICKEMIDLYQNDGIVAEPAGALSISALDVIAKKIKGKKVVVVVSGGNNDISRYPEVLERSLIFQGLKHYFIIEFSQRPGALRAFLDKALGTNDDITFFEYTKKNSREYGPALVGIELTKKDDYEPLLRRMTDMGIKYQTVNGNSSLFTFLV